MIKERNDILLSSKYLSLFKCLIKNASFEDLQTSLLMCLCTSGFVKSNFAQDRNQTMLLKNFTHLQVSPTVVTMSRKNSIHSFYSTCFKNLRPTPQPPILRCVAAPPPCFRRLKRALLGNIFQCPFDNRKLDVSAAEDDDDGEAGTQIEAYMVLMIAHTF